MINHARILAAVIVALVFFGLVAFFEREFLVAGVIFLTVSFAIFVRETRL